MRAILDGARDGVPAARLALDVYLHRLRASIATMAASLDGLDAIVFTGGVGERSAEVRAMAADGLGFLGIALDPEANDAATGEDEADVSATEGAVRAFVIPAREAVEIAREVRKLLAG